MVIDLSFNVNAFWFDIVTLEISTSSINPSSFSTYNSNPSISNLSPIIYSCLLGNDEIFKERLLICSSFFMYLTSILSQLPQDKDW